MFYGLVSKIIVDIMTSLSTRKVCSMDLPREVVVMFVKNAYFCEQKYFSFGVT